MLHVDRKYLWQLVEGATGSRSTPFVATVVEFKNLCTDTYSSEDQEKFYVLLLADTTKDIPAQELVSRFPLYRVSSFIELDFNVFNNSAEVSNHG